MLGLMTGLTSSMVAPAAPAVATWIVTMGGVAPALALLTAAAAGALLLGAWIEARFDIAPPRPGKTVAVVPSRSTPLRDAA